jgi:hypothetical protein
VPSPDGLAANVTINSSATLDVNGHAWIGIEALPGKELPANLHPVMYDSLVNYGKVTIGYYPAKDPNILGNAPSMVQMPDPWEVPGEQEGDAWLIHDNTESFTYPVPFPQENFDKIMQYIKENKDKGYNFLLFNCTHFAQGCIEASGMPKPQAQGAMSGAFGISKPYNLKKDLEWLDEAFFRNLRKD